MQGIHGGDIYRNNVMLDFSVNINPLGMPGGVEVILHDAVGRCVEYPDILSSELHKAVSDRLSVPEKYLLFGNGASEIFMGIVHAIRPKKVLIPVPSFYGYEYAAKAVDCAVEYLPLKEENSFGLNEELKSALSEKPDVLFLANPNNPTGQLIDGKYLKEVLEICRQNRIYVVLDECFIEFCEGRHSMVPEIEKFDNLLIVRAFTKSYSIPGVRLGYLVCCEESMNEKIGRQLPEWNLSVFAQMAGTACAGNVLYMAKTVEYVKEERRYLEEGLRKLGLSVFPGSANFLLFRGKNSLYEELLEHGILIRNCDNFRGLSKGFYRIAVKNRKENEILLKVMGECIAGNRTFTSGGN